MTKLYSDDDLLFEIECLYEEHGKINTTIVRNSSGPTNATIKKRFGSLGEAVSKSNISDESMTKCSDCGGTFEHLGKHTAQSDCDLPELTDSQKEIVIGILLGDGTITESSKNCEFALGMVAKEFVYWVNKKLSPFSSKVIVKETNNKDLYRMTTTPHKYFTDLRDWYSSGAKRFPEDLELTPMILKMWYVTDGGRSNGYPRITSVNESDRFEYLLGLFEHLPFDVRWDGVQDIQINSDDVDEFYDYIGDPVPGFEYKWP